MDHALYEREIKTFHRAVESVLRQHHSTYGGIADLRIVIAEPSRDVLDALRAELPRHTVLLYLFPLPAQAPASFPGGNSDHIPSTLLCPLTSDSFFADKVSMIVTFMPDATVALNVSDKVMPRCQAAVEAVNSAIKTALGNSQMDQLSALPSLRAFIRNLPALGRRGVPRIPKLEGATAVVCGAGPSLVSHLEDLKRHAEHLVLIAVGHAAPCLLRAGVQPDIIVEIDSLCHLNWGHDLVFSGTLFAAVETSPSVTRRFGRVTWFTEARSGFDLMLAQAEIPVPHICLSCSVSISAIDIAIAMGCDSIALVGQDLCVSDSGHSHACNSTLESHGEKALVRLPGTKRAEVWATPDLVAIRDALQEYVVALRERGTQGKRGNFELRNCTENGAVILGISHEKLSQFCQRHQSVRPDKRALVAAGRGARPRKLASVLAAHADILHLTRSARLDTVAKIDDLLGELHHAQPDIERLRQKQSALREVLEKVERARSTTGIEWLATPIRLHIERFSRESHAVRTSNQKEAAVQLRILREQHVLGALLEEEIIADIAESQRAVELSSADQAFCAPSPSPALPQDDHLHFQSYFLHALTQVRNSHPEYADALANGSLPTDSRFEVIADWTHEVPYVRFKNGDGASIPLSNYYFMRQNAEKEVRRFLDATGLPASHLGVVMVAPGNWIHPIIISEMAPEAALMTLDPWPGLFAELLHYSLFLHRLPPQTATLATTSAFPSWRGVALKVLDRWRGEGRQVMVFPHPSAAEVAECRLLREELAALLKDWRQRV